METKIEKNHLIVKIPLQKPAPSKSGKTKIVATTNGFVVTDASVNDKPVHISLNAFIK